MNAVLRKKRKSQAIEKSSKLFSEFIEKKDYESASSVVFWCVLKGFGKEGIMDALDEGNSFIERKRIWRN